VFGVESGVSTVQPLTYFGFYHGTNVGACSPTLLHYMTKLEMRGRGGGGRNKKQKPPSSNFGDLLNYFKVFSATLLRLKGKMS
jgi:hypothetical protein